MKRDYYEILGLSRGANAGEIKKAYRNLARELHPDRNPDKPEIAERFKEVNEAYAVLSDEGKRQRYDTLGSDAFHAKYHHEDIMQNIDLGSIFEELGLGGVRFQGGGGFGGFGRGARPRPQPPRDMTHELEIGFEEAIRGSMRTVHINLPDGSVDKVEVKVPAGVDKGHKLRVRNRGGANVPGGMRGDLYLKIKVAAHPEYSRKGQHLEVERFIPLSVFLLGGTVTVQTPDGERTLKVPAGSNPGMKLRLRDLGVPGLDKKTARGHFYVCLKAEIPDELTEEQVEAAKALQEAGL